MCFFLIRDISIGSSAKFPHFLVWKASLSQNCKVENDGEIGFVLNIPYFRCYGLSFYETDVVTVVINRGVLMVRWIKR